LNVTKLRPKKRRRYKKLNDKVILNTGLSEEDITRKKIDIIKNITALLFNLQFGISPPSIIRPFKNIERTVEKVALLNKTPIHFEAINYGKLNNKQNIQAINNVFRLIQEVEKEQYIEELLSIKKYLVGFGGRKLMNTYMKDSGYNSQTIRNSEKLYTIAHKLMDIYKDMDRHNYQGIKAPMKKAIDGCQQLINILVVNDR
jgi:hypothetical protein